MVSIMDSLPFLSRLVVPRPCPKFIVFSLPPPRFFPPKFVICPLMLFFSLSYNRAPHVLLVCLVSFEKTTGEEENQERERQRERDRERETERERQRERDREREKSRKRKLEKKKKKVPYRLAFPLPIPAISPWRSPGMPVSLLSSTRPAALLLFSMLIQRSVAIALLFYFSVGLGFRAGARGSDYYLIFIIPSPPLRVKETREIYNSNRVKISILLFSS
jgi:hypothetical protein